MTQRQLRGGQEGPTVARVVRILTFISASRDTTRVALSWIVNNSTTGVINSNVSGTPNRLLFKSTL